MVEVFTYRLMTLLAFVRALHVNVIAWVGGMCTSYLLFGQAPGMSDTLLLPTEQCSEGQVAVVRASDAQLCNSS